MDRPAHECETWCCNQRRGYNKWLTRIIEESEWDRWFNLHSRYHMAVTYPRDVEWYKQQTKAIYFQKVYPDIPASLAFPKDRILEAFNTRYFTCSAAWLTAFAILEQAERIEYWGVEVAKRKPTYSWERPCLFYWVNEARKRGIDIWYPEWLDWDLDEAGDGSTYSGPLYGFETRPEI